MGRKSVNPEDYKINVKLRLKRSLREQATENKINLSHLLEEALIKHLNKIEKEKRKD